MMIAQKSVERFFLLVLFVISLGLNAQEHEDAHSEEATEEAFNPTELINHHVSDSHEFHIADWDGHAISMPLPVILWTENGLVTFMSSEFHHDETGEVIVEKNGQKFARVHDEIYYADGGLNFDEAHHVTNSRPLNFSITKNVFTLMITALLM